MEGNDQLSEKNPENVLDPLPTDFQIKTNSQSTDYNLDCWREEIFAIKPSKE